MATGIKVFAPASVANLACGYDILGLALERPGDEIIIRKTDGKGLKINKIFGADRKLPTDIHKNTAGLAAYALLKSVDRIGEGIEMDIYKKMPKAEIGAVFLQEKKLEEEQEKLVQKVAAQSDEI